MYKRKSLVKWLDIPENRRILVISDIHGNMEYFRGVLEMAGFCDEDTLIIDGDFIEKGSDSLGVLRYSVMWPLAWGLVMLRIAYSEKIRESMKPVLVILICLITFPSDWSCIASLCILAFGTNRGNFKKQMLWLIFYVAMYSTVYYFALDKVYGLIQMAVVLAIPVLGMYNGQRGHSKRINAAMKWLFYTYYPLHLFVIGWIQSIR